MSKLENISDQLEEQSQKTAELVRRISRQYNLRYDQALEIVRTAAISQFNDTFGHIKQILDEVTDHMSFD